MGKKQKTSVSKTSSTTALRTDTLHEDNCGCPVILTPGCIEGISVCSTDPPKDAVKMWCSSRECTYGGVYYLHGLCYREMEEILLKILSCNSTGKEWTEFERKDCLWDKGYEFISKKCRCHCGLGQMKRLHPAVYDQEKLKKRCKTSSLKSAKVGWTGDGSKTALSDTDGRLDAGDKTPPAKKHRDPSPPMPRKPVQRAHRNKKLNEMRQCGDGTEWTLVRSKNKTPADAVSVSVSSDRCSDGDKELVKKVESKGTIQNVFDSYGFIESKQMDTNVFFAAAHVRSMLDKSKVPALATMFKVGDAVSFSAKPQIEKSGCRWIAEWVVKQNKPPAFALQVIDPKPSPKKVEPTVVPPITNNEPVLAVVEQVNAPVTNTNHGLTQSSSSMQSYNSYGQGDPEEIVRALLESARQAGSMGYCMFSNESSLGIGECIYEILRSNHGGTHPLDLLINTINSHCN